MLTKTTNIILLVLILGLQYRLWFGFANFSHIESLNSIISKQKSDISVLETRNATLIYEVLDLKHGSDALEEYAREEVGMIKKGEIFYQVLATK